MNTVNRITSSVNIKRRPGRPRLRTLAKEREIIRRCVRAAIATGEMPSDVELGRAVGLKERTVRDIRLGAGLNRWHVAAWNQEREMGASPEQEGDILCMTPYAGLWLLAPVIIRSALLPAAHVLAWTTKTGVDAWQWIMTVVMWAVLGFRRFFHLDDLVGLHNDRRWPIIVEMTCFTSTFHRPEPTLDASLVRLPGGGAVATWGPTGLGVSTGHDELDDGFFRAIFADNVDRVGEATLLGKMALAATGQNLDLLDTFTLLGDPATRFSRTIVPWNNQCYLPIIFRSK